MEKKLPPSSAPAQRELGLSPEAPNGKVKRKIHNDAFKNGATPEVIADAVDDRGRPKDLSWSFITPATTNAANELSQKLVGCRRRRQGHCTPYAAPHQSPAYRGEATSAPHAAMGT
jgi:hypothetical protein